MDILIIMGIGIFIGLKFFPDKYKKKNEKMQMVCTILIIFSMGVMLGRRENFLQEITSLGLTSFLYFFIPTLFSILIVYLLTRLFMKNKSKEKEG
ncbi:MAG TPA: hypothetical protein DHW61_07335 [Lachnoclostridium phytofermentans]|uniref:DUF340 domain-containing protein n=1 Tax=Lachnoclostridium phytofermentans TaxID=66219 RepID=A0A3D2X6G2_9FIRM|nr:hypothetical protein [Lachnoclostridium sp.]HCL02213.1 hypothetical protein [Lachnoclostridium phytofermentans]